SGSDPVKARRFLHRYGAEIAFDLVALKRADVLGKRAVSEERLDQLEAFRQTLEAERSSPYRLTDLAVDGSDLIDLGFEPGPTRARPTTRPGAWRRTGAGCAPRCTPTPRR